MWKLLASTTFEIYPTFNLFIVPAKILHLQRYSTDLPKFCLSSKMLRVGIWVNSFRCAGILLLQSKGENFEHRQHWKFCHFQLVDCGSKNPISPMVFTDFRNLCLGSKMFRVVIWVEGVSCGGILLLQLQGEYFANRQHLKFCHIQLVHCGSKNPTPPKVFNRFSKSPPELEDVEGGHLGGKFQVRRYFTFEMARRNLRASTTFEILPLSTCTLLQQKSNISKGIQTIFEIFAWARRYLGWAIGWKVSSTQVFYFCNGKVKTLGVDNIWNFATFNLFTGQQKSHISQSIQPIFEIFASARRCWEWAFGWKVSGAQVFYFCNGKAKILRINNTWNFATFNL